MSSSSSSSSSPDSDIISTDSAPTADADSALHFAASTDSLYDPSPVTPLVALPLASPSPSHAAERVFLRPISIESTTADAIPFPDPPTSVSSNSVSSIVFPSDLCCSVCYDSIPVPSADDLQCPAKHANHHSDADAESTRPDTDNLRVISLSLTSSSAPVSSPLSVTSLTHLPFYLCPTLAFSHSQCLSCFLSFLSYSLSHAGVGAFPMKCPHDQCKELIGDSQVLALLERAWKSGMLETWETHWIKFTEDKIPKATEDKSTAETQVNHTDGKQDDVPATQNYQEQKDNQISTNIAESSAGETEALVKPDDTESKATPHEDKKPDLSLTTDEKSIVLVDPIPPLSPIRSRGSLVYARLREKYEKCCELAVLGAFAFSNHGNDGKMMEIPFTCSRCEKCTMLIPRNYKEQAKRLRRIMEEERDKEQLEKEMMESPPKYTDSNTAESEEAQRSRAALLELEALRPPFMDRPASVKARLAQSEEKQADAEAIRQRELLLLAAELGTSIEEQQRMLELFHGLEANQRNAEAANGLIPVAPPLPDDPMPPLIEIGSPPNALQQFNLSRLSISLSSNSSSNPPARPPLEPVYRPSISELARSSRSKSISYQFTDHSRSSCNLIAVDSKPDEVRVDVDVPSKCSADDASGADVKVKPGDIVIDIAPSDSHESETNHRETSEVEEEKVNTAPAPVIEFVVGIGDLSSSASMSSMSHRPPMPNTGGLQTRPLYPTTGMPQPTSMHPPMNVIRLQDFEEQKERQTQDEANEAKENGKANGIGNDPGALTSLYFQCETPGCGASTCLYCDAVFNSADESTHRCLVTSESQMYERITELLMEGAIVRCPNCSVPGAKDSHCAHINCSRCSTPFCYCCGKAFPNGFVGHNTNYSILSDYDGKCPMRLEARYGTGMININGYNSGSGEEAVELFHLARQRHMIAEFKSKLTSSELILYNQTVQSRFPNGLYPIELMNRLETIEQEITAFRSNPEAIAEARDRRRRYVENRMQQRVFLCFTRRFCINFFSFLIAVGYILGCLIINFLLWPILFLWLLVHPRHLLNTFKHCIFASYWTYADTHWLCYLMLILLSFILFPIYVAFMPIVFYMVASTIDDD